MALKVGERDLYKYNSVTTWAKLLDVDFGRHMSYNDGANLTGERGECVELYDFHTKGMGRVYLDKYSFEVVKNRKERYLFCSIMVQITRIQGGEKIWYSDGKILLDVWIEGVNPTGPVLRLVSVSAEGLEVNYTSKDSLDWTFKLITNSEASKRSPLLEFEVIDLDKSKRASVFINNISIIKKELLCDKRECKLKFDDMLNVTNDKSHLQIFALNEKIDSVCWTAIIMRILLSDSCKEASDCESWSTSTINISLQDAPEKFAQTVSQSIRNQSDSCAFRISSDQCSAQRPMLSPPPLNGEWPACNSNALNLSSYKRDVYIRMRNDFNYSCPNTICAAQLTDAHRNLTTQKECYINIGEFSDFLFLFLNYFLNFLVKQWLKSMDRS